MRIDVGGEACPFCVPAMERLDVESRVLVLLRGKGSARLPRSAALARGKRREDTSLAHQLLAYAIDEGVPERAWRSIIAVHLRLGGALATLEDLLPLAWNLGLDVDRTSEVLVSRRYRTGFPESCPFLPSASRRDPVAVPVVQRCGGAGRS